MALRRQQPVTSAVSLLFLLSPFYCVFWIACIFLNSASGILSLHALKKPTFGTLVIIFLLLSAHFDAASGDPFVRNSERPLIYTRNQPLGLRDSSRCGPIHHHAEKLYIPAEIRRRRRGCRGGRTKRRKGYLPSVDTGNVRSLRNKTEELTALTRFQSKYRDASIMCFTETWLDGSVPNSVISTDGFKLIRADRTFAGSGKKRGGGLAVFVNERWCNAAHVHVKQQICCSDVELLAVSLRPYYLPREFGHVIVLCVYIPPCADAAAAAACERINAAVNNLQTQYPRALLLITGDFNHASLHSTLPTLIQYVTCKTRDNKTLDLFYANVKYAYTSAPSPLWDAQTTTSSICSPITFHW
ncbi:uncharacterized protein LOC118561957 [Fundulus heteroclitus]|uniref:uncharacterized protein LOC118561957 n=1 Tax=Fundulus heteroclitus TaxID=8078 RepID=UPI00165A7572|nr:uncharacterized protein LOC118561957 [Fundulus heteroclitus]XP_035990114.1 uncharacterized protein LOC118561957 [Fundulus heteroclitus]XP_035990115.1 uncharacterized protein LOC118561957 [Fundulus heteroclitus]